MSQSISEENNFFVTAYFIATADRFQLAQFSDPQARENQSTVPHPQAYELYVRDIESHLKDGLLRVDDSSTSTLPTSVVMYPRQFGCYSAVYIPIQRNDSLHGLLMVGARKGQNIGEDLIDSYQRTIRLTLNAIFKTNSPSEPLNAARRAREIKALNILASSAATVSDLKTFYSSIHDQTRSVVGEHEFVIALYDENTNSINIPYFYEGGKLSSLESFPLGEGLTSLLIRTREPLLLVEDTERRALAMGAKITGKPAKSWMGIPLLTRGEAIGAIILQDIEKERAFNEDDLRFVTAVANQISGSIHNIRLLHQSQQIALHFETAAEIARDISGSLNLDELLFKAVDLIRSRFDFYHASVFLKDIPGEFVVVREATGEEGAQLKRANFKLPVASKSIIGVVADKGETLVVNDTERDTIFLAHPALPNTHSEAAFPLKVADRILGVLDVQSDHIFAFTRDNLRILQILADQLAIAVINSELFAETQEHLAQHRLLHHITTTAASGTTLDEALQSSVNGLQVTLGGDRVSILLVDRDKKALEIKAAVGYTDDIYKKSILIGSGITGWSAFHKRSLRVNNVLQDSRYIEGSPNTRSELAIPLLYRGELLGILNVESEQIAAYGENDEELLGTLGGSLAAIIANARLLEQIRSQAERERILYEISDKIRRTTDMQTILATTASELTRAVGATSARIKLGAGTSPSETKRAVPDE